MDALYSISSTVHTLAAVIWVGSMFFAHMILRPALMQEKAGIRLGVWSEVFTRFFKWVWAAIILLALTGYIMVGEIGGFEVSGLHVRVMHGLFWVMTALFTYLFFKPYTAFKSDDVADNIEAGAKHLAGIRRIVIINLTLGLLQIILGVSGRFYA
ncbi:MAG: hypothetical protein COB46_11735 [Rhodospirillaceae bacterium]|nr:MAG: hypothetical protein COB46_11735 [Rhodospirillaceae bacterium]